MTILSDLLLEKYGSHAEIAKTFRQSANSDLVGWVEVRYETQRP
jgi:hypothetical protein